MSAAVWLGNAIGPISRLIFEYLKVALLKECSNGSLTSECAFMKELIFSYLLRLMFETVFLLSQDNRQVLMVVKQCSIVQVPVVFIWRY